MKSTHRCRTKAGLVLLTLAASAPVQASERTRKVAVCPWQVGPKARHASESLKALGQEQAQSALGDTAAPREVESALGGQSCAGSVESLAPLAAKTGAAYALYVRAEGATDALVLHWALVSHAGVTMQGSPAQQTYSSPLAPTDGGDTLEAAVRRFYEEAVAPRLQPVLVAAEDDESTDKPSASRGPLGVSSHGQTQSDPLYGELREPHASSRAPSDARWSTWEWVGVTTAGTGAAVLLTSGLLALSAGDDQRDLSRTLDENGQLPNSPDARVLLRSLQRRSALVNGTLAGGAALVAAGALTYWLAPSMRSVKAGVAPAPGGGTLHLEGRF